MKKYDACLVCNDKISEVRDFLAKFFKEKKDENSSKDSVTFIVPESGFQINLKRDYSMTLTQGVTFETSFESGDALERFAKKNNTELKIFLTTEAERSCIYNYVEVPGPHGICKLKIICREGGHIS